ncbi:aminoglycoside phosphotransferase family protein [Qipengyuania spongiae]|uniref:Phosphotransferase n=1 Tax=Qipengyuania spongiae TaxID=2909673 RepID=A0ABY5T2E0_9SPHN|nr:phosphotransferase [Qipengyuania spongiae]UVI39124.1 phosphotransferase [Qipengyuania spongiae]
MSALPDGIETFLSQSGWAGAAIEPLPGDASFRRYFRLRRKGDEGGQTAMLMHAPPPHEDPAPFLHAAEWLSANDMRAPDILAQDVREGWVLIEDFGDRRMREWIDEGPGEEEAIYAAAIDSLVALHRLPPGPFAPYDLATYLREADLLTEWYCPAMGLSADEAGYREAWEEALLPLIERQHPGVTVLRDYHAENIMLPPDGSQGLIDFQDALVGHPAYDLVSLLQDARRDVSEDLERRMLDRYLAATGMGHEFEADYARLGAQRNAKIVGIFTRLHRRDGKPRYLAMIPRVWQAMERDLAHPALAPVARWFEANIPQAIRDTSGGEIM